MVGTVFKLEPESARHAWMFVPAIAATSESGPYKALTLCRGSILQTVSATGTPCAPVLACLAVLDPLGVTVRSACAAVLSRFYLSMS